MLLLVHWFMGIYDSAKQSGIECCTPFTASYRAVFVIMRLKRDPCVTGTQGDCRGGNKTVFSVLKGV